MGAHDQRRSSLQELAEGRDRGPDAEIVGDLPVLEWDIQVAPDQDGRRDQVGQILQRPQAARAQRAAQSLDATRPTKSTSRFEYPHSLSYQPMTFTRLPMTMVESESNTQEYSEPTTSLETMGSSV